MPRGVPKAGFRRTKNRIKAEVEAAVNTVALTTTETDDEIHAKLTKRFSVLERMTKSSCLGHIRALIVSGPAGLGKSFTVEEAIKAYDPEGKRTEIIKGFMRPTGLYKMLHAYRHPGNVLVFDDCDTIFKDADALNLLKAACDTTEERRICWGAETRMTDDDGTALPWSFTFEGTVIFITNYDFDDAIERGTGFAEHFKALMSRAHYIDCGMKSIRDYLIRIRQVVDAGMLERYNLSAREKDMCVNYVFDNASDLRELTLRMVIKIAGLIKSEPFTWEDTASVTLIKNK
jgi:hypothetical protein